MAEGDYPLLVYVWNKFSRPAEGSGPILSVTFNHWPNGEKPYIGNLSDFSTNANSYQIMPGDMIGFPLYWNDETLEIHFNPSRVEITGNYYISLDSKGIWTSDDLQNGNNKENIKWIPSGMGEYIAEREDRNNKAGVWEINDPALDWSLTFHKLRPDPETTNITVGPVIL